MRRSTIVFLVLLLAVLALSLACGADEASRGPTTTVLGERPQSDPVETVEDEAEGEGDEQSDDVTKKKKKKEKGHGKDDKDTDD